MPDDLAGEMQAAMDAGGGSPPPEGTTTAEPEPSPRAAASSEPQQTKPDGRASAEPRPQDVPVDVHKRVVDGFHKRLDALGWAAKLDPDRVTRALEFFEQAAAAQQAEVPSLGLQTEDGIPLEQVLSPYVQHIVQQALAAQRREIEQQYGPVLESHEEQQRWTRAGSQMEPYLEQPWFAANAEAITTALADARANGSPISLEQAILQVMTPHWLQDDGARMAKAREAVLAEMDSTHADASQAVSPRRPASTVRRVEDTPTAELIEEEMKRRRTA